MNPEGAVDEAVPVNRELTKWDEWRAVVGSLGFVVVTGIVLRNIPVDHTVAAIVLLGIGLLFDLVSVAARISTAITGRHSSGFFIVGFVFYFWAWLSYPGPVILETGDGQFSLWLRKSLDILCMGILHILCHVSFGRESSVDTHEANAEQANTAGREDAAADL